MEVHLTLLNFTFVLSIFGRLNAISVAIPILPCVRAHNNQLSTTRTWLFLHEALLMGQQCTCRPRCFKGTPTKEWFSILKWWPHPDQDLGLCWYCRPNMCDKSLKCFVGPSYILASVVKGKLLIKPSVIFGSHLRVDTFYLQCLIKFCFF